MIVFYVLLAFANVAAAVLWLWRGNVLHACVEAMFALALLLLGAWRRQVDRRFRDRG